MTTRAQAAIKTQLHRHQQKRKAEDTKVTNLRRQLRKLQREARHKQRQQAGEWVDPGDPVLRIVNYGTLRIEGFVDSVNSATVRVGPRKPVQESYLL